ncbi:hypothetical protein JOC55_001958 [Paenibacillus sacheonensis]|nr:hypothetical protein [Paenibacillus sacheonensis]
MDLYEHLCTLEIQIDSLIVHSWFWEFDFCDTDGNKLKVCSILHSPLAPTLNGTLFNFRFFLL